MVDSAPPNSINLSLEHGFFIMFLLAYPKKSVSLRLNKSTAS